MLVPDDFFPVVGSPQPADASGSCESPPPDQLLMAQDARIEPGTCDARLYTSTWILDMASVVEACFGGLGWTEAILLAAVVVLCLTVAIVRLRYRKYYAALGVDRPRHTAAQ